MIRVRVAAYVALVLLLVGLLWYALRPPASLPRPPKGAILVRIEVGVPGEPRGVGGDASWKW
ncbi:MAG: hypothetical protein KM310_01165 [Clostridiales bacterium]|nr:hypothetical protein [Clostridiales bacterium]